MGNVRHRAARGAALAAISIAVLAVGVLVVGPGAGPPARAGGVELQLEDAFPGVTFRRPILALQAPDDTPRMFVVEQRGRIQIVDHPAPAPPATATERTFIDLSSRVSQSGNERGLLGMAFHPDYAQNGRFFVHYSRSSGGATVLAEYAVTGFNPDLADFDSERVLLVESQPYANHNGGMIAFGQDGMLYMALGDGGSAGDPDENGQDLSTILGAVLRIDVDRTDPGSQYAIPPDNPFLGRAGARGEIWAYGLRNPWRFSFDSVTGELWLGDVGQNAFEEIDLVEKGGNYGWDRKEGFADYEPEQTPPADLLVDPLATYGRGQGISVTGGYVYRGSAIPSLVGTYLYADYVTGKLWGLTRGGGGQVTTEVLLETGQQVSSFGEDRAGEIYLCSFAGEDRVYRLFSDAPPPPPPKLPPTLSETGLFDDLPRLRPREGAHRYAVRTQLWSDRAKKDRFVVLPPGEAIQYRVTDAFDLPVGAWAVKTFTLEDRRGRKRRLETRVILRTDAGFEMGAYRWRPELDDADLVKDRAFETVRGRKGDQEWMYPSQADCLSCHTEAAGSLLGLNARQLRHRRRHGPDLVQRWAKDGVLAGDIPPSRFIPRNVPVRGARRTADRARSYMDANCSFCHRPGAPQPVGLDLRATTAVDDLGLVGVAPTRGDLGIVGGLLIHPGDSSRSVLPARVRLRGDAKQMPPLGSALPDSRAAKVLERWIRKLR